MRVLSGIQPSGQLHWGNYFGSIRPNLELAAEAEQSVFFVADLHALTTIRDPEEMQRNRMNNVLDYLACGLDPNTTILFFQSAVSAHAELTWMLSTVTPVGLLERAVSYKEKVEKGITASAGLFTYPVLMTADILLYDATHVPVGKDQKQHLEMARDIAMKFNHAYGKTFTVPEPLIREEVAVVPGVDGQKMSKSYGNTIPIFGDEGATRKAIMDIKTDSKGPSEPKDPESSIIFQLHRLFLAPADTKALEEEYRAGISYGEAKKRLLERAQDHFAPMRTKRAALEKTPKKVEEILHDGATKASKIAGKTLRKAQKAVGLI